MVNLQSLCCSLRNVVGETVENSFFRNPVAFGHRETTRFNSTGNIPGDILYGGFSKSLQRRRPQATNWNDLSNDQPLTLCNRWFWCYSRSKCSDNMEGNTFQNWWAPASWRVRMCEEADAAYMYLLQYVELPSYLLPKAASFAPYLCTTPRLRDTFNMVTIQGWYFEF